MCRSAFQAFTAAHPFLHKSKDMMQSLLCKLLWKGSKSRLGAFGVSSARVIAASAAAPAQAEADPSSSGALTREFQIYRYEWILASPVAKLPSALARLEAIIAEFLFFLRRC